MKVVGASYPVVPSSFGTHRKVPDNGDRASAGHHPELCSLFTLLWEDVSGM